MPTLRKHNTINAHPNLLWGFGSKELVGGVYSYSFNGKETDNEIVGTGKWQDYGERMYRTDIARFFSPDPLIVYGKKYAWYSPYQFAGNKPIVAIDLDGLEEKVVILYETKEGSKLKIITDEDQIRSIKRGLLPARNKVWISGEQEYFYATPYDHTILFIVPKDGYFVLLYAKIADEETPFLDFLKSFGIVDENGNLPSGIHLYSDDAGNGTDIKGKDDVTELDIGPLLDYFGSTKFAQTDLPKLRELGQDLGEFVNVLSELYKSNENGNNTYKVGNNKLRSDKKINDSIYIKNEVHYFDGRTMHFDSVVGYKYDKVKNTIGTTKDTIE